MSFWAKSSRLLSVHESTEIHVFSETDHTGLHLLIVNICAHVSVKGEGLLEASCLYGHMLTVITT